MFLIIAIAFKRENNFLDYLDKEKSYFWAHKDRKSDNIGLKLTCLD